MAVAASAGDQVVQHRGWFIFLSLLLIVAGAAAIAFPILSTFAVELWRRLPLQLQVSPRPFTPWPRAAGADSFGDCWWVSCI